MDRAQSGGGNQAPRGSQCRTTAGAKWAGFFPVFGCWEQTRSSGLDQSVSPKSVATQRCAAFLLFPREFKDEVGSAPTPSDQASFWVGNPLRPWVGENNAAKLFSAAEPPLE